MPIAPGARLGVYEILAPIGAGGMGEVYRAHDTKLNRHVAITVLSEAHASDPERITRFHREAQAIAALNHVSIATIYDLAEASLGSGDPSALVRFLVARDGAHLLFSVQKGNEFTLWTMTLRDRKTAPFGGVAAREATFSPAGRWVAYQAREDVNVVYVEPFPRTGAKYVVSRPGGHPFWSPKDDEIVMNVGPSRGSVVGMTTTPRVAFAKPAEFTRVGRIEQNPLTSRRNADMMPDGRVIGVRNNSDVDGDSNERQITIVLNWHDELKRRVPSR